MTISLSRSGFMLAPPAPSRSPPTHRADRLSRFQAYPGSLGQAGIMRRALYSSSSDVVMVMVRVCPGGASMLFSFMF